MNAADIAFGKSIRRLPTFDLLPQPITARKTKHAAKIFTISSFSTQLATETTQQAQSNLG
ncbi:MAG: hypothetical protein M3Q07_16055 [Pseudobdellovibrionaceae bacterium]|nr:hypothetical protein [Pseudobdellovibrionaceae bacterium]